MVPARLDRKGIIDDQPFLVGPYADKIIGFFVGAFAPFLGVLTTGIAMLVWAAAAAGGEGEAARRRRHAVSVAGWAALGTVVMLILVLTIFLALVGAAVYNPSLTPSAPPLP
jgi:hypothetical protein